MVPEQELPDGDFPTVSYPNPEADEAFTLGLKLAKQVDADLEHPDLEKAEDWLYEMGETLRKACRIVRL